MLNKTIKRATGPYYTCSSVADYIAQWAIRSRDDIVLELSFGDGNFLQSAIDRFKNLGEFEPEIIGVELQKEPYDNFMSQGYSFINCYMMDYMDFVPKCQMSAIIGNPPYVSLKNLSDSDRKKQSKE